MRMRKSIYFGVMMAFMCVVGFTSHPAWCAYPEKAIELIIHMEAGSAPDIEGRVFASEFSKILGKPVVPINKPGGGGAVAYTHVKNAKPDGYTIAWNSMSILTCTNIGNVPFDYDALEHVGQIMTQPMWFTVRGDAKWKTIQDFVADAKKNPGTLKIGSAGTGSSTHLSGLALEQLANIKVIHVPLGAVRQTTALLAGEIDANFSVSSQVLDLIKAKKLRFLLGTGEERNPVYPDIPTMKESGYDVALELFRGVSVPKGTPPAVKAKLEDALMKVAKTKAMKDLSAKTGLIIVTKNSADFTNYLAKTDKSVKDLLKKAGLYRTQKPKK
jgi:tripartite-type tricarboxylate transporter receptor subunit TctC